MAKEISIIYEEYKIMPALREHMFRVAAVASLICDNFDKSLPKYEIITACLLHDMGNIIKSNLDYFPEFLEPEGLEYWQKVKEEYESKYGLDEHIATEIIAQNVNISEKSLLYLKSVGFSNATKNELEKLFDHKICSYADMRVGPYGVLSLEERMLEGRKRYKGRKHSIGSDNFESLAQSFRNIEKQIFAKCKIKPEDINDERIKPIISELRNFVIK